MGSREMKIWPAPEATQKELKAALKFEEKWLKRNQCEACGSADTERLHYCGLCEMYYGISVDAMQVVEDSVRKTMKGAKTDAEMHRRYKTKIEQPFEKDSSEMVGEVFDMCSYACEFAAMNYLV